MSYQRKHSYCGGKGYVTRTSGAPGHCFGCSGTGKITVRSAREKAEAQAKRDRYEAAKEAVRALANTVDLPEGVYRYSFRGDVVAGFENLGEYEPARMAKLYASLDAGRGTDVVNALYAYRQQRVTQATEAYNSAACTQCRKAELPTSLICDRAEVRDLGAVQQPGAVARYEGVCLRCCQHNHG